MPTIWVQATTTDRKVIVSEYDESHPTPNHEAWIVGYPDVTADDGTVTIGNPPIEVGDTALIRQRIADKLLIEVERPTARQRAAADKAETDRLAAEQAAADKAAAAKAAKDTK